LWRLVESIHERFRHSWAIAQSRTRLFIQRSRISAFETSGGSELPMTEIVDFGARLEAKREEEKLAIGLFGRARQGQGIMVEPVQAMREIGSTDEEIAQTLRFIADLVFA